MNVHTKIAISVIGGLLVATALVGTLVAVVHMHGRTAFGPGSMMGVQAYSCGADRNTTPPCLNNDAQPQGGLRRGPGSMRGFSSELMNR